MLLLGYKVLPSFFWTGSGWRDVVLSTANSGHEECQYLSPDFSVFMAFFGRVETLS